MEAAAQQQHGLSDDEMPAELRERQQLLNEAAEAILNGRPAEAKQKLAEQETCADRARARVRERERFA
jgi:hypothetical protein